MLLEIEKTIYFIEKRERERKQTMVIIKKKVKESIVVICPSFQCINFH